MKILDKATVRLQAFEARLSVRRKGASLPFASCICSLLSNRRLATMRMVKVRCAVLGCSSAAREAFLKPSRVQLQAVENARIGSLAAALSTIDERVDSFGAVGEAFFAAFPKPRFRPFT